MSSDRLPAAIASWREALGPASVIVEPERLAGYQANVTEYVRPHPPAVLAAHDRGQIVRVLEIANAHGVPIYPFSRGRNWGLGSKLPVSAGCVLLDLGGMDRILEVNERFRYAIVEPGVTQKTLHQHLVGRGLPLLANVTGSGDETSILGNLVERGVGMRGPRLADLRGLEGVTGSGRIVRTGLWHCFQPSDAAACVHHHPPGFGPDLTGLFLQSSFAVVTAAVIGLHRLGPISLALLRTRRSRLSAFVEVLAELRASGLLCDRIEIDCDDDPRLDGMARPPAGGEQMWWTWVPLWGDPELAAVSRRRLTAAVSELCDEVTFFEAHPAELARQRLPGPVEVRFRRLWGEPDNQGLQALARAGGVTGAGVVDIDDDPTIPGFVCALPAVPLSGQAVSGTLAVLDQVSSLVGVKAVASFNTVSAHACEGYLRVTFDRRKPEEVRRAHRWNDLIHAHLARAGLHPMRLDIQQMARFVANGDDDFWKVVSDLKGALDPNSIIAPGRYCP